MQNQGQVKTVKVSQAFLEDFRQLTEIYKWDESDVSEIRQAVRENTGYRNYLESLAAAHRNGYIQNESNNYIRLHTWADGNLK